jgi:hypothetical protein
MAEKKLEIPDPDMISEPQANKQLQPIATFLKLVTSADKQPKNSTGRILFHRPSETQRS